MGKENNNKEKVKEFSECNLLSYVHSNGHGWQSFNSLSGG